MLFFHTGEEMQKFTLKHIGAISLGRLLAVWSFVLGFIFLILWGLLSLVLAVVGLVAGADLVQIIISLGITFVMAVIGLFVMAVVMFIFGFLSAIVYNIILGVGGGIDFDVKERT
jgi:hypothetical protein